MALIGYTGSLKTLIDQFITGAKNRANHTGTQAATTITGLAPVATTGIYGDLTGRPDIAGQINAAVNALVNGAPGALDQLSELAAALGNDANFAATVTNALAGKATPAQVQAAVDALGTSVAATYVTFDGTNLRKNGTVIPVTGSGSGLTVTDNGDGTLTFSTSTGASAGLVGSAVVGTSTIAA